MNNNKILIIGAKGNMGRRYSSICKYLQIPFDGVDICDTYIPDQYSHCIIATPTNSHLDLIQKINDFHSRPNISILCEKPIALNNDDVHIINLLWKTLTVYMVNQYAYYPYLSTAEELNTTYDFYNSGNDPIAYNCIQLVHLAKGPVLLKSESPIWRCVINGKTLDRGRIDRCYVDMVHDFFFDSYGKLWGREDILEAHRKAYLYDQGHHRNSSPQQLD